MEVRKAKTNRSRRLTKPIWDRACELVLLRSSPCGIYNEFLDRGVNYFVLMLEQLGATTEYSCEGHPDGFYIVFNAPLKLALKIRACGFFRVELEGRNRWSLRTSRVASNAERKALMRMAATQWNTKLGPLTVFPDDNEE